MKITVTLALSPVARVVVEWELQLEAGATVAEALQASGLLQQFPQFSDAPIGIWGRKVSPRQPLRDRDRIELYRPLKVDPKLARRARFVQQGVRAAGLFARNRPGSKAGY